MKTNHLHKKCWVWLIGFVLLVVFGILIPIVINEIFKLNTGYSTLWGAADTLAYYGSFSGAVGTIILGTIAWQQNKRLLRIEESSFIANNACMGFINQILILGVKQKACNFHLHDEQVVSTVNEVKNREDYESYSIQVEMEMKDNIAALVKINSINLFVSQGKNESQAILDLNSSDTKFSRVAISPKGIKFAITTLVMPSEKEDFLKLVDDQYSRISIDMDFTLLTDKYVSTHLKCRSLLVPGNYSEDEKMYNEFKISADNPPICFWYGNSILDKKIVTIKQADLV